MFLQQPRRHKPNTGSRGLPVFLAANVGSPKCLEGYFLIAICNCYMPRNTHRTFTWKELDLLFSLKSKWKRTELVFTLPLYTCVPVDTHTHRAKAERDRQGCGLWDFVCNSSFVITKCFSNLYAHFFVVVSAAPLLCRCTLCRELIWQNDDSSESVQCINDFVFWISSLCSSLFFLCKLFVVQSINAVPTREAQTNRNYVHIQHICRSK